MKLMKKEFDSWSAIIADYLLNEISEDDFINKADNDNEKLCEVYCYIGFKNLYKGNKQSAEEYFKKTVDTKVESFFEYKYAKNELSDIRR